MPNRSIRETIRFGTLFRLVGVRNCPVKHMEPRQRRFSAGRQQACKDKQSNRIVTYPAAQICNNHLRHPLLSYVSEPESKLRKSPTHIIFHIAHRQPKGPTTSLLDGYIYHVATLHPSSPFHASLEKIRDSASCPHGAQFRKAKPRQNLRRHILSPSWCFGTYAFSVFQHVLDDCQPYIACISCFHDLSTFCTSARMWKACADI